ncbi:MAG: DUF4276 family protein [Acidobacteria bacterium]|nr:DUF4276 family protein [Acidobacteriota bacterium]
MKRLLVHVEGGSEEAFVNKLLCPHLVAHGVLASARLLGHRRERSRRGGIVGWPKARGDLLRHLKKDHRLHVTTIVDYYGLPQSGKGAWPGRRQAASAPFPDRADFVEEALRQDVDEAMGSDFVSSRFVPFVMMHEFEALLFSDCQAFANAIGRPALATRFQAIRDQFSSPEEINDSQTTAPSKRLAALLPGYSKTRRAELAALAVGLDAMRSECPHFRSWLESLEGLSSGVTNPSQ